MTLSMPVRKSSKQSALLPTLSWLKCVRRITRKALTWHQTYPKQTDKSAMGRGHLIRANCEDVFSRQRASGHHGRTPRSSSTSPRRDMSNHVNQTACVKCWFGCWVIFHALSSLRVNPPMVSTYGETSVIRQPCH